MRLTALCAISLAWHFLAVPAVAAYPDELLGEWTTEDRQATVEIFKKGDRIFGKIVALTNPHCISDEAQGMDGNPRLDLENPDKSLRRRPLIGLEIIRDFSFDNGSWRGGTVYDPESGNTYRGRIRLDDDGALILRGFVGLPMFGRTSYWHRPKTYSSTQMTTRGNNDE